MLAYKDQEDEEKTAKRRMFESNLEMEGLELETEHKSVSTYL